ncbi:MAG: DUF4167 domain-containing protein [Alphaproteobacteria bacterium]|nr:DUF4167 domain-containing protein [Alphaproteobacteria bacterium]
MKKIKYRNNNFNNQVYSINYKFDSVSPAGKCCGTALDLIKRYNELAKEAQSNGNYVEAEVFRQYAEHYRKIVTEINERKNLRFVNNKEVEQNVENSEIKEEQETSMEVNDKKTEVKEVETAKEVLVETKPKVSKKSFTVIDVTKEAPKTKRASKPRAKKANEETVANQ